MRGCITVLTLAAPRHFAATILVGNEIKDSEASRYIVRPYREKGIITNYTTQVCGCACMRWPKGRMYGGCTPWFVGCVLLLAHTRCVAVGVSGTYTVQPQFLPLRR